MLTVIIGGSGSGKSAFAEALVRKLKGERIYLATMAAGDPESLRRIARHRKQREHLGFATVEQPLRLFDAVIPAGSYIYMTRWHESGTLAEIRTEDGTTALVAVREADPNDPDLAGCLIDGVMQYEYFDNIFFAD